MSLYKIIIRGWEYPVYGELLARNDTWIYIRQLIDWVRYDGLALIRADFVSNIQEENSGMLFREFLQVLPKSLDAPKQPNLESLTSPLFSIKREGQICTFFAKNDKTAEVGVITDVSDVSIKIRTLSPKALWQGNECLKLSTVAMIAWETDYIQALTAFMLHPQKPLKLPGELEAGRLYSLKIRGWKDPAVGILLKQHNGWLDIALLAEDYRFDGRALINRRYITSASSDEQLLFKESVLAARGITLQTPYDNEDLSTESALISWLLKYAKWCAYFRKNPDAFIVGYVTKPLHDSFYCQCVDSHGDIVSKPNLLYLNRIRMVQYDSDYLKFIGEILFH